MRTREAAGHAPGGRLDGLIRHRDADSPYAGIRCSDRFAGLTPQHALLRTGHASLGSRRAPSRRRSAGSEGGSAGARGPWAHGEQRVLGGGSPGARAVEGELTGGRLAESGSGSGTWLPWGPVAAPCRDVRRGPSGSKGCPEGAHRGARGPLRGLSGSKGSRRGSGSGTWLPLGPVTAPSRGAWSGAGRVLPPCGRGQGEDVSTTGRVRPHATAGTRTSGDPSDARGTVAGHSLQGRRGDDAPR